jgi:hypothetical protein
LPGSAQNEELERALQPAMVAMFLVNVDFLALSPLLETAGQEGIATFSVILDISAFISTEHAKVSGSEYTF